MPLLYFILGIIFIEFLFPAISSIFELFQAWIEVKKGKFSYKIAEINEKIQDLQQPEQSSHAIGFVYEPEEEYDEEDDL